jgi:exodeoxyribonuclease VII large subunit
MQMSLDTAMERTFSVAEFGQLVSDVLTHTFPHDVWIQGEVRDMVRANSGHVYFTLVDANPEPGRSPDAALSVVLFDSTKRTVNTQLKRSGGTMRIDDGVSVRIRGVPDFYAPQGRLSLRMTGIDPAYTLGQMAASRERLLRLLADEGILHANRQRPVPLVPLRLGLVTAAGSAAAADFLDELAASGIGFEVRLSSTVVQGPGAPPRIAAAIRTCERLDVDVIAVVRGGGARTDLAAFDDELVARAIAGCSTPVLTGIGHEVDTAVADEVAHLAFKTPTACAAHLVGLALAAEDQAATLWRAIATAAGARLIHADTRLTDAAVGAGRAATTALRDADRRTAASARRVRDLTVTQLERSRHRLSGHLASARLLSRHRLDTAEALVSRHRDDMARSARERLSTAEQRLDHAELQRRLLDPAKALARGWSITTAADGAVVRSVADVVSGSTVTTRVADGTITSTVTSTEAPKESP